MEATTKALLTGPPSCGKTTAALRLVERLPGLRLAGFYTSEISTGQHAILAHDRSPMPAPDMGTFGAGGEGAGGW